MRGKSGFAVQDYLQRYLYSTSTEYCVVYKSIRTGPWVVPFRIFVRLTTKLRDPVMDEKLV